MHENLISVSFYEKNCQIVCFGLLTQCINYKLMCLERKASTILLALSFSYLSYYSHVFFYIHSNEMEFNLTPWLLAPLRKEEFLQLS